MVNGFDSRPSPSYLVTMVLVKPTIMKSVIYSFPALSAASKRKVVEHCEAYIASTGFGRKRVKFFCCLVVKATRKVKI